LGVNGYVEYKAVTKELLDFIRVGDRVKVNDWKAGYEVRGVSANYFVMARTFGKHDHYSVCEKKPWEGVGHNAMRGGMFHVGTDFWCFGAPISCDNLYRFANADATAEYLGLFEDGVSQLSCRTSVPIKRLYIKRAKGDTER